MAGTRRISDIYPGTSGSDPQDFTLTNGHLVFRARDLTSGEEPWVLKNFLWQLTGGITATAQSMGFSASANAGLELVSSDPKVGGTLAMKMNGMGAQAGIVLFGFSTTQPFLLSPGAYFYFDIFLGIPLALPLSATGTLSLPIPNHNGLVGASLSAQAFLAPGTGTPLGLDVTNGVYLKFGD